MDNEKMRAEFEAHIKKHYFKDNPRLHIIKLDNGDYGCMETSNRWFDWKAALQSRAESSAIINWLANGYTGVSSKSLAFDALGILYNDIDAPRDPADLNRCLMLISAIPCVRKSVDNLAPKHKRWEIAAKNWDEMASTFEEEIGIGWRDKNKRANLTYALMIKVGL